MSSLSFDIIIDGQKPSTNMQQKPNVHGNGHQSISGESTHLIMHFDHASFFAFLPLLLPRDKGASKFPPATRVPIQPNSIQLSENNHLGCRKVDCNSLAVQETKREVFLEGGSQNLAIIHSHSVEVTLCVTVVQESEKCCFRTTDRGVVFHGQSD